MDPPKQFPNLLANAAASNKKMRAIWIVCGKTDPTSLQGAMRLDEMLTKYKIQHAYVETEGVHEWKVWCFALHEFAPLLFQANGKSGV